VFSRPHARQWRQRPYQYVFASVYSWPRAQCRLSCVPRGEPLTAHDVLGQRHWFEMGRIYTATITAKVIKLEPTRDVSNEQFVCVPMRVDVSPEDFDHHVAVGIRDEPVLPTSVGVGAVNVAPKSSFRASMVMRGLAICEAPPSGRCSNSRARA
jgi:hypothetical protein